MKNFSKLSLLVGILVLVFLVVQLQQKFQTKLPVATINSLNGKTWPNNLASFNEEKSSENKMKFEKFFMSKDHCLKR